MLDTKSKKSRKFKNLIIALAVLLPALVLVCLYPQMERAMCAKKAEYLENWQNNKEAYEKSLEITTDMTMTDAVSDEGKFYLRDDFVNYAVESGYYLYAIMLQRATGEDVFENVLQEYGWINDFYELKKTVPYYARYVQDTELSSETENRTLIKEEGNGEIPFGGADIEKIFNDGSLGIIEDTQLFANDVLGYLVIQFDRFGNLSNIELNASGRLNYDDDLYQKATASIEQYENNALYYAQNQLLAENEENHAQVMQVCPKSFEAVYLLTEESAFVDDQIVPTTIPYYTTEPSYSPQELYLSTGAYAVAVAFAVLVFVIAMLLPFIKKLETGWERLFCIPTEIVVILAAAGMTLAYGMCLLMSVTTVTELTTQLVEFGAVELLGYKFSVYECYYLLLVLNFTGWATVFFVEYICVSQLRQFFCNPKFYIQNRFLTVRFLRWTHKKIQEAVNSVLDCERSDRNILWIVVANFVIVALLCCGYWLGILGAVIYSTVLFWLLKKYNAKKEKEYSEIYAKAAMEEAKSQSMKSELITNVSHDLKTPLTAIITYVDLLKNPLISETERNSYIQTLDLKSQRLKVLIEDLFEISKANSGNVVMDFMEVDVVHLLKEVRVEMSDKIEESNLDFRWNLPEEKVLLELDGQRTYRIFENLLINIIKYAMPSTRVYVGIVSDDSKVEITFKNISAQELGFDAVYLTERFVRGDSSRKSEGSGLGLAIAKSFTELQHGSFSVSTDGDLFKVEICFKKSK